MADRLVFLSNPNRDQLYYEEIIVEFTYFSGFAVSQKQKSIKSLHENALKENPDLKLLEISTKSDEGLGVRLSAFNLKFRDGLNEYPLENIFQSSKVYEHGGPFADLLNVSPKDAKKDTRHHTSGALQYFKLGDWECGLEPKTMFYDWIFCKALSYEKELVDRLIDEGYNAFTDIEFNQKKSINCQARSTAIFTSLFRRGQLEEYLDDKEKWRTIYTQKRESDSEQIKFDFGL